MKNLFLVRIRSGWRPMKGDAQDGQLLVGSE
jgi:hypothetical protein